MLFIAPALLLPVTPLSLTTLMSNDPVLSYFKDNEFKQKAWEEPSIWYKLTFLSLSVEKIIQFHDESPK